MVGHDVCHYCEVAKRSARQSVYAHRGRPSEHRVPRCYSFDDSRSDDVDRCDTSAWMRSNLAGTRQQRNRAGERRSCSPPHTAMVPGSLVELSHAMSKTDVGRLWLPAAHARRPEPLRPPPTPRTPFSRRRCVEGGWVEWGCGVDRGGWRGQARAPRSCLGPVYGGGGWRRPPPKAWRQETARTPALASSRRETR